MNDNNTQSLREQFAAIFNRRDVDAAVRPYAEDATLWDHALGQTVSGEQELREYFQQQMDFSSDQQIDFEVVDAGEWTIAYGTLRGTHDGPLGPIEATHNMIELEACNITRWRDGKIVEDHVYYDLYSVLVQLGKAEPLTQD